MAIALAGVAHSNIHADTDAHDDYSYTEMASFNNNNQFIEDMFIKIHDGVIATVKLVKSFTDRNNTESFTSYLKRCEAQMSSIVATIINPLELELKRTRSVNPSSRYTKLIEKTLKLASEKAYKELEGFYIILRDHRNQKDPAKVKSATHLANKLQPHLERLLSDETLDLLDESLADIQAHLPHDVSENIVYEVAKLIEMAKEIRVEAVEMRGKVKAELLLIIGQRLKKL